jgi:hypothetical protein
MFKIEIILIFKYKYVMEMNREAETCRSICKKTTAVEVGEWINVVCIDSLDYTRLITTTRECSRTVYADIHLPFWAKSTFLSSE